MTGYIPGLHTGDIELIETWAEHGIPTNTSTQEYAAKLLVALLASVRQAWDIIDQYGAQEAAA